MTAPDAAIESNPPAPEAESASTMTQRQKAQELIRRGVRRGRSFELELGIVDLVDGLRLLDERKDSRLALSAYHNLAVYLANLELPILAQEVLERSRELSAESDDPTMRARRLWLEGTIAALRGENPSALEKLEAAAYAFYQLGEHDQVDQINAEIVQLEARIERLDQAAAAEAGNGETEADAAPG